MSKLLILKWRPFEYKANFEKRSLLFSSEIAIFDIFFKRLDQESFEDLQIISDSKFQTRVSMSHKMVAL